MMMDDDDDDDDDNDHDNDDDVDEVHCKEVCNQSTSSIHCPQITNTQHRISQSQGGGPDGANSKSGRWVNDHNAFVRRIDWGWEPGCLLRYARRPALPL